MLKTNYNEFENDLGEILREFGELSNYEFSVFGNFEGDKFIVSTEINDKKWEYNYDFIFSDELEKKRLLKRYLKISLYKSLTFYFERNLPWGSLTGIRPTKLAYQYIENNEDFESKFLNELLVSKDKTEIVKKIINAQKPYYEKNDDNCDFFVGIPFCPSRCAYCSFLSNEIAKEKNIKEYIDALIKEIEGSKKLVKNLRSVYIGGGTPVSLKTEDFLRVLDAIGKVDVEYTVEAGRPDVITEENLKIMKEYGVTRVCVNPQTFSDETLQKLGRRHTAKECKEKYALVRSFGFDVNMDLIAGLIGEDFDTFKNSLDTAISLNPENITVHTLALKRGSRLRESVDRLTENEVSKMVEYAHSALEKAGYSPYYLYRQKYMAGNLENTGYAKKGKECIYNIDIMEEIAQIIASGANAVSKQVENAKNKIERVGAPKDIKTYIDKIDQVLDKKFNLYNK